MPARPMFETELGKVEALARQLWPDESNHVFDGEHVFVWEDENGAITGFASVSIRPWVDGAAAMLARMSKAGLSKPLRAGRAPAAPLFTP
jgi:hypothetical protein